VNPLEPPDSLHFQAAQGWLELGDHVEANAELQKISQCRQWHPDVLNLRWEICAAAQSWRAALETARSLIRLDAEEPLGWIHRAYALHKLKRTTEARDTLLLVAPNFPISATLRYNLARYECQLGHLEEAKKWLAEAFHVGLAKKMRLAAPHDPDLEPLWKEIGKT
jgi:predicted Zn-dependent protease